LFSELADNFGSLRPFPQDSAPPSEPFADKTITDTQCKVPEDITFRKQAADKGGLGFMLVQTTEKYPGMQAAIQTRSG